MKLTGFILAFFYFFSSVGYGLEVHYCLGEVSDVSYALFETHCACDALHDSVAVKCCEEKSFFNQIDTDHSAPVLVDVSNATLPLVAEILWNSALTTKESEALTYEFTDRGPPKSVDRVIEYHALIIYG